LEWGSRLRAKASTKTARTSSSVISSERFVISSNFKREPNGAKWAPKPCKA